MSAAAAATEPSADAVIVAEMDEDEEAVSPKDKASMEPAMHRALGSLGAAASLGDLRADPDAQATVTDFLDFTEHLPSDVMRSLTLVAKLDETYVEASRRVDDLTTTWARLPTLPAGGRPPPERLRADVSENLARLVGSRVFSHAEAARMAENVGRHYNRAKTILAKLQTMMENYPTAEEQQQQQQQQQKSPVAVAKSPQLSRAGKVTLRVGDGGPKSSRRPRVPRITVPGEVLAPYELDYGDYSDESDESSSSEESESPVRRTPPPRIKLLSGIKKDHHRPARTSIPPPKNVPAVNYPPPPDDAVIGSADLPWMQLVPYEMVRLRKRMKKNPTWEPSQSMILRELEALGRGPTAFKAAEKKAQDEGREFDGAPPEPTVDPVTGEKRYPLGGLNQEALEAEGIKKTNRGMKLNEFKKHKKELAKIAAEEAEESARKMAQAAKMFEGFLNSGPPPSVAGSAAETSKSATTRRQRGRPPGSANGNKRKRDEGTDVDDDQPDAADTPSSRPQIKRTKTETPVPPPNHSSSSANSEDKSRLRVVETPVPPPQQKQHSTTPVPIPIPGQGSENTIVAATKPAVASPGSPGSATNGTTTTTVPTKPPAETPIPPPILSPKKSITPIPPPLHQSTRRETRQEAAAKKTQQQEQVLPSAAAPFPAGAAATILPPTRPSSSRGVTPRTTPGPPDQPLRPRSRGKAMSQEPPATSSSLAAERPRRASTARNTPAPEQAAAAGAPRPTSKRAKRPAPGVVSTTSSGGNSAVGKRKAPPKKKARAQRRDKGQGGQGAAATAATAEPEMEEVDDEGNPIDPDEPRYCLCNRVSFGTMIQCDNMDNCEKEWFHLECVGLEDIPARTTKWYCLECRVLLNIGEKGEVNSRGVKM